MWAHKLFCLIFITLHVEGFAGDVLLASYKHGILRLDVDGKSNTSLLTADQPVVAFDIHNAWAQIYWATDSTIYRTPLYDTETTTPLAEVGRVGSLTVDWIHNHLYWTDVSVGAGRLEVAHLDGGRRRIVHHSKNNIGSMVMDPLVGKLFWIEWNDTEDNKTTIMSCQLDGSSVKTLYESEFIPKDGPLSIDITFERIFFYKVSGNHSELWDINYEGIDPGKGRFEIAEEIPKSLSLSTNGVYFSNKNGTYSLRWVMRRYTFVFGNRTAHISKMEPYFKLLDQSLRNSSQIRLVNEVTQIQSPDHCAFHTCEHDCVAVDRHQDLVYDHQTSPDRYKNTACVCRYGYALREDGRTCAERGYLIYSSGTTFGRITPKGEDNTLLYNDSSANIQAFDVDVDSEYIYWSDLFAQAIYRAPIEQISRKEVVVADVNAYGLALDWLHDHVYWSDQSRILVSAVEVGTPVVILDELFSPANIALDPIDKYIFWVSCGNSLSIQRAGLDGSDVTMLVGSYVTCGLSLTADHDTQTLFWLDWAGTVSLCRYDGSSPTRLDSGVVRSVAIIDHQPLWTLIEYSTETPEDVASIFQDQLKILAHDLQPSMIKVVKKSHQPRGAGACGDVQCDGVCIPTRSSQVPLCVCAGEGNRSTTCPTAYTVVTGRRSKDYLELVEMTPFSATLRCAGPLLTHPQITPSIHVQEVDSLVTREEALRMAKWVQVVNKTLPFTIDGLNPATTYRVTVRNRVTKASSTLVLHTPPPPLSIKRRTLAIVPGIPEPIVWGQQGVHYPTTNPWEHLVHREYFLLLISSTAYTQSDPPAVPEVVRNLLLRQINASFMILSYYKTKEEFDDDPVMNLANLPWGEEFVLAMVQITEYQGSYNLDVVYSNKFGLPDPYWQPLVEKVLEEQEVIDSIERL